MHKLRKVQFMNDGSGRKREVKWPTLTQQCEVVTIQIMFLSFVQVLMRMQSNYTSNKYFWIKQKSEVQTWFFLKHNKRAVQKLHN